MADGGSAKRGGEGLTERELKGFPLGDGESLWLVLSGTVDVFAREGTGNRNPGRRHHLVRVGAGGALFGGISDREGLYEIVGVAAPGSSIRRLSGEVPGRDGSPLLHGWVRALSEMPLLQREEGPEDDVEEAAARVLSVPPREDLRKALDDFHDKVMTSLRGALRRRAEDERLRLEERGRAGGLAMKRAVSTLASTIERERPYRLERDEVRGSPLVEACRLAGSVLGIEIRGGLTVPDIARASRVRVRRVMLRGAWWREDNGPMVAFLKEKEQPVALLPTTTSAYELVDPASGVRETVTADRAGALIPLAFTFDRSLPERLLGVADLLRFGLGACSRQDLITVPLMGAAIGLLGVITPIASGVIFDSIIPGVERAQLFHLTAVLLAIAVGASLFEMAKGFAELRIETRMGSAVQAGVWDRLLGLPVAFFRRYLAGDLALRSMGIESIRQVLTESVLSSILGGIFSLFNLVLLFYYHWRLALLALGLVVLATAVSFFMSVAELRYQRIIQELQGKVSGMVFQFITGIAKLRVSGAEEKAFAQWAGRFAEQKRYGFKARLISSGLSTFNAAFPVLASFAVFIVVFMLRDRGSSGLSTGEFVAFNAAFGQFLAAGLDMGLVLISVLQVVPLYERARPILETHPEVDVDRSDPGTLRGDVELTHVSFRYDPDGPLILNDVSLKAAPGEFIAVVGPSGAGKSTIFRLLLGFETPVGGSIYYNGQDLAGLDIQKVRRQMGIVIQNSQVLPGTIFENIVGSAPLTMEDAWEAARMAGLDQDVERMPMGMHTFIPEGGSTLSGGQRQRLLIARALVRKPRILLFDEATSALDNQTQAQVSESLEKLKVTRLVIAHRLSTIMRAHRIYVLAGGRVVQAGRYEELMAVPGPFADLASRQLV